MRARNLKPSIYKNYELALLGDSAFRLFTGLWCMADRQGRLKDEPGKIQGELFPFRFQVSDIDELLGGLASGDDPFIVRYQVNGEKFISICNFLDHQKPHPQEVRSAIPPCKENLLPRCEPLTTNNTRNQPLPSLSSLPSSPSLPSCKKTLPVFSFQQIYDQYPNKDSRKAAERRFNASVKTEQDFLDIQIAIKNYIAHLQLEKWKNPKSAGTWFHDWRPWVNYKGVELPKPSAPTYVRHPDPKPEELPDAKFFEELHKKESLK